MMTIKVPFFRLSSSEEEISEVAEVIRSGWLTTSKKALVFENHFARYVGAQHALAVNSCTAALHLALEAIGIGAGDRVVVPAHTFTATAEVVRYLGADVIFTDIDRDTFCMDIRHAETILTGSAGNNKKIGRSGDNSGLLSESATRAIMPVHFGGHPCQMDEIMKLADRFDLKVIEDAAHALPTSYQSVSKPDQTARIGTIGDVTCFSFYANKTITTGEGGMIVTDDDDLARRIKIMRLHGIDRDIWDRFNSEKPSWYYEVVEPGFKYNMTDIAAAIGISQLKKCDTFHLKRLDIARQYIAALDGVEGIRLPKITCSFEDHSWHLFVLLVEPPETGGRISRDEFIQKLSQLGVATSVHYIPLHLQPYYRDRYHLAPDDFPNSTWVYKRCVSLPIFPDMRTDEVDHVVDCIKRVMG